MIPYLSNKKCDLVTAFQIVLIECLENHMRKFIQIAIALIDV